MNGVVVFIVGLIAGVIGGCVVALVIDGMTRDGIHEEIKEFYEELEKMNDNHAIDIADLHNDIEKTIWLDDLTIKGLQDQVNELKHIVEEYRRWSLGCWNDICYVNDKKQVDEAIEESNSIADKLGFANPEVDPFEFRPKPDGMPTIVPYTDEYCYARLEAVKKAQDEIKEVLCDNPDYVEE